MNGKTAERTRRTERTIHINRGINNKQKDGHNIPIPSAYNYMHAAAEHTHYPSKRKSNKKIEYRIGKDSLLVEQTSEHKKNEAKKKHKISERMREEICAFGIPLLLLRLCLLFRRLLLLFSSARVSGVCVCVFLFECASAHMCIRMYMCVAI